jgi:integrase
LKRNRNPRFVKQYRDRAGNWVNQYRRAGKLFRLPNGRNFTEAWWVAYYEAEHRFLAGDVRKVGETRTRPHSIDAALVTYYRSTGFLGLAANSRRVIKLSLERDFRPIVGSGRLAHLRPKHIVELVAEKAQATPTGARLLLAALRSFLRYCVSVGLIATDPTLGVKGPRVKSDGHHTWTEAEIAMFEMVHPVGSLPRLAMALHLFTAQRSGDVQSMGWQHVRDGAIHIVQQKTGAAVAVPIHADLRCILDALPRANMTFLVNTRGAPLSDYNARWRRWIAEAGLRPACVPHGLRAHPRRMDSR